MEVVEQLGITSQVAIAHLKNVRDTAAKRYPGRFVFAKYLPTRSIIAYHIKPVLKEIKVMAAEGYSMAKMWVAPAWRHYTNQPYHVFDLLDPRLAPIFETLTEHEYPLLIHASDPDTYYSTAYANSEIYGTKEAHLQEFEALIQQYPDLQFQLAHFAAQPEIRWLPQLGEWFDKYPNIVVDTASSRWMARELSKDPKTARRFMIKYSKRILFGTDASLSSIKPDTKHTKHQKPQSPYYVRCIAQRILWETKDRNVPLPFPDTDTEDIGGTFINGLNLSLKVLKDLYWKNAQRLYGKMVE